LLEVNEAEALWIHRLKASTGVKIGLAFKRLLFLFYLDMEVDFLLKQPGELKLDIAWKLAALGYVRGPLRDFRSERDIIIRQRKLQEVIIVHIPICIFVIELKELVEIRFINIVNIVLPQKSAKISCTDDIGSWIIAARIDSFECSVRLEFDLLSKSYSLVFNIHFVFRYCFEQKE